MAQARKPRQPGCPLQRENTEEPRTEISHTQSEHPGACRVLVIDDEISVLKATEYIIRSHLPHWTVDLTTASGALARLVAYHYDVILSDIKMPDLDGIALMRQAHYLLPFTPVVFMTGYANEFSAQQVLEGGAVALLEKPLDASRLVATLQTAARSRR